MRPKALEWSHVVFVRQGREGIWYLNGEPDRPVRRSRENFRIANSIFDERRAYKGILDEVFVFKRMLTQLEVSKVMEKGLVGALAVDARDKIAMVWGRMKS